MSAGSKLAKHNLGQESNGSKGEGGREGERKKKESERVCVFERERERERAIEHTEKTQKRMDSMTETHLTWRLASAEGTAATVHLSDPNTSTCL
jgi:hypothetical protein